MRLSTRFAAIVASCLLLGACSSALQWEPDYYVVRPGDTIYSIAFRHDIDQRDLMAWNGIGDGALIRPGQRLRLTPPAGEPPPQRAPPRPAPARPVAWQWPTDGQVIAGFGSSAKTRSGIHIGGRHGQPVRAASAGRVVYAGTGLAGYGHLLIIKHNNDFLSAYGHNERLLAKEGDAVEAGQRIANMGEGPGRRPLLHFEIRIRGEPTDPLKYLPRR